VNRLRATVTRRALDEGGPLMARIASPFVRGALLWGALPMLAACAVVPTWKSASYEGEAVAIAMACEEPFDVRENERRRRLEVSSPFFEELGRSFRDCEDASVRRLTKAERFHRAATDYLKRSGRSACAIESTTLLAINRYEFTYRCGEPGSKSAAATQ
jgi:hypothetical protein